MKSKIHALQGFRAFAILSVLTFHYTYRWADTYGLKGHFEHVLFMIGHFGVQVFFMISGFIIYSTLQKTYSLKIFLKNRAIRLIVPALILEPIIFVVAKYGGIQSFSSAAKPLNLLPSITLIDPGYWTMATRHPFSWVSGVQWTLSIEIAFYVFAGTLYFLISKKYFPELLFAGSSVATLLDHIPHESKSNLIHGIDKFLGLTGFPLFWWFVLGVLIFRIYENRNSYRNIYLLILSIAWVLLFTYDGYKNNKDGYSVFWVLFYVTGCISIFLLIARKNQFIVTVIGNKPMVWLGDNSYEFYLVHEIIGVVLLAFLQKKLNLNSPAFLAMAAILTVFLFWIISLIRKSIIIPIQTKLKI